MFGTLSKLNVVLEEGYILAEGIAQENCVTKSLSS